jgi:hypothetical protein
LRKRSCEPSNIGSSNRSSSRTPGFIEALTADDFVETATDGSWLGRAEFVARMRSPQPLDGATYDDVRVRLFGSVALVHGLFEALHRDGKVARVRYTDVLRLERGGMAPRERQQHVAAGGRRGAPADRRPCLRTKHGKAGIPAATTSRFSAR